MIMPADLVAAREIRFVDCTVFLLLEGTYIIGRFNTRQEMSVSSIENKIGLRKKKILLQNIVIKSDFAAS